MRRRKAVSWALMALVGVAVGVQPPVEAAVSDAAIIALNSIELKRDVAVTGDVVVNEPSTSATLVPGVDLEVDQGNDTTGDLYAESMSLSRGTAIHGDLYVDSLVDKGATYDDQFDYQPPVLQPLPLFRSAFPASGGGANCEPEVPDDPDTTADEFVAGGDCFVDAGSTETISAGKYGAITIAQGGTLALTGGGYDVDSVQEVDTDGGECPYPCRSIVLAGPTQLRVAGQFDTGSNSYIGPTPAESCDADSGSGRDYVIYVAGGNADPTDPNSLPPTATVGKNSVVCVNFLAPHGTFLLDRDGLFKGSVIARDVRIDRGSQVILDSAFNAEPIAESQTVTTSGGTADIVLTATDADGDMLTFTAVEGPFSGSLPGLPASDAADPTASVSVTYSGSDGVQDYFIFTVDDGKGGTDTARVDINASETCLDNADCAEGFYCKTDVEPEPVCVPTGGLAVLVAQDGLYETAVNEKIEYLILSAQAPDTVGDLKFFIVTQPPAGEGEVSTPPVTVSERSARVSFEPATDFVGSTSFNFKACETPELVYCDQATISVDVQAFTPAAAPVAIPQNVTTPKETEIEINLADPIGAEESTAGSGREGCGNGVLDPEEQCDDGNRLDGDGCSSECQIELE